MANYKSRSFHKERRLYIYIYINIYIYIYIYFIDEVVHESKIQDI